MCVIYHMTWLEVLKLLQADTEFGETFTKRIHAEPNAWVNANLASSPVNIEYYDHTAIGVKDIEKMMRSGFQIISLLEPFKLVMEGFNIV